MTESPEDYELFHYGVKGMKWGVRKKTRTPITKSGQIRQARKNVSKMKEETRLAKDTYGDKSPEHKSAMAAQRKNKALADQSTRGEKVRLTGGLLLATDLAFGAPATRAVVRKGYNFATDPRVQATMKDMAFKAGTAAYNAKMKRNMDAGESFWNEYTIKG